MSRDHALALQAATTHHREVELERDRALYFAEQALQKTSDYEESLLSLKSDNAALTERNNSLEASDAGRRRTIETLGTNIKTKDTQIEQYRQTIIEQKVKSLNLVLAMIAKFALESNSPIQSTN